MLKPNRFSPNFKARATQTGTKLFLRESTGLVKRVSILDAISLNISNTSAGTALALIGFTIASLTTVSGLNLVAASIIAFAFAIPQIVVYTLMTRRVPRTGGDYVWVSRSLGGAFGASASFMAYTAQFPMFSALVSLSVVSAIGTVGLFFGLNTAGLATPGADPVSQFVLGSVIFGALVGINILKPKAGFRLISALTVVSVLGLILAIGALLVAGHSGVVNYMNSFNDANLTYAKVASSYTGPGFDLAATLAILPFFSIFVYPYINGPSIVGSELKGRGATRWNVPVASIVVFALLTLAFAAMYYAGGFEFTNEALANPTLQFAKGFNFWTLAMGVSNNALLAFIMGISLICWNIMLIAFQVQIWPRMVFAQAFDRYLPTKLADVSRNGALLNGNLVNLAATVIITGVAVLIYGTLQVLFASVLASVLNFCFVGVAAAVFAVRKDASRSRVLIIAGVLQTLTNAFIVYQMLSNPILWGTSVTVGGIPGWAFAYGYVAGSFAVGALVFLISRSYNRARGIDITMAYKEIPPE